MACYGILIGFCSYCPLLLDVDIMVDAFDGPIAPWVDEFIVL
jgi:hypothetical protein